MIQTGESPTLKCNGPRSNLKKASPLIIVKALTETRTDEAKQIRKQFMKEGKDFSPRRGKELKLREDDNANTVTATQGVEQLIFLQLKDEWDVSKKETWLYEVTCNCGNVFIGVLSDLCPKCGLLDAAYTNEILQVKSATKTGFEIAKEGDSINLSLPNSKTRRGRVGDGVAQTLDTQANQSVLLQGNIRRLTEIECERLQGFKDNHTQYGNYEGVIKKIPKTQRYKLCGNAVNVSTAKLVTDKLFLLF